MASAFTITALRAAHILHLLLSSPVSALMAIRFSPGAGSPMNSLTHCPLQELIISKTN